MSAAMKAGFFLVILAGSFLPSAGQGNTTIAASSGNTTIAASSGNTTIAASSVTTEAPTATVTTQAPTTADSNSTNSTSPGDSNSRNSTNPGVTTEAPTATVTTQAPTTAVTTEAPTTAVTTQAPKTAVTTEAPTNTVTTQAPTTAVTTEAPTNTVTTQAPKTAVTTEAPTTAVTTQAPKTADSNSTNSTSPGDSNSTNSTNPGDSNSTNSTNPGGSNSTNSTTTSPGDSSSVNLTDSTDSTTVNPGDLSSTVLTTTANSPVNCKTHPCGTAAATCTDIYGGRICRCPYGYYYDKKDQICSMGKQFFGSLTVDVPYSPEFKNVSSPKYKSLYDNVTEFFILCFQNDTSYAETIITKITVAGVKSRSLNGTSGTTDIETISIFTASSTITQDNVTTIINNTRSDNPEFTVKVYTKSSPCKSPLCDEATTTCNSIQNDTTLVCDCKAGYYKRLPFSTSCPDCEVSCTVENKKECIQKETKEGLVPACQCLISHKPGAKNDTPCVQCDYGYSGVHCKDSFQLILIIVGSIAGALVLALLGGVFALSLKSKKADKSPDRERLIKPEDNAVFGNSQSTEVPQFPRVAVKPSTNTNNASTANPYETDEPFQRTVPTRDYDDDTDSWFEMAPKNTAFGNNSKF